MSQDPRRLAFVKALIAAAWADGELSPQEIKTLSYYLQRLQVDDAEYEQLRPLLQQSLDLTQARQLLEEQLRVLSSAEDRRTLVAAVEDLLVVDDRLVPSEAAFLREVRELTSNVPTAQLFVSRLRALWSRPPGSASPGPAGRGEVEQFVQKRLLEHFRGRVALARARAGDAVEDGVPDADLYRAVITAGLLTQVAQVDQGLCPAEEQQLMQLLSVGGKVPRPDLEVIVTAFSDGTLIGLDLGTLVREYSQLASEEESALILDGLFLVAAADGELQEREVHVIRQIAQGAGFAEDSFLAAWERCRRRMADGWN